jgi:hypothetical protein
MVSLKRIDEVKQGKRKITKGEFDRLMVRGWKEHKKPYVSGRFITFSGGMCAIGVVMDELGLPKTWETAKKILPSDVIWDKIADTSNDAGNKTAAIKTVKAIQWEE